VHQNFEDEILGGNIYEKREEKIQITPGPGFYSPEKADAITMPRAAAVDFKNQPERPN
jgi:hypothetical protein